MTIYFYKGLTRNPEIENTPVWVLRNIWRLEQIMDAKFGPNISNRMLLNASKFQGYSFYRFWVIKGEPTGGGGDKITPPHSTDWWTYSETPTSFFAFSLDENLYGF